MKYTFWNNKGGTGKSSLCFQTICEYAILNPDKQILAIDICPQANLSELLLGGMLGDGGNNLNILNNDPVGNRSIGGYFQLRLENPFNLPNLNSDNFICAPHQFNPNIPENIDLIAGDRIVELQANSISALSITQIPGVESYIKIVDWLNDLIVVAMEKKQYHEIFIDTNPSFAIYTQIALAATDRLLIPVMADDSSRRALRNVFSLVYGLNLPSAIYNQYAFNTKLTNAGRQLPDIHLLIKNRLTQYMGPASAYGSVLTSINEDITAILVTHPQFFSFNNLEEGLSEVRDFQTTGVVAFAEATPFSRLRVGNHTIFDNVTQVRQDYLQNCIVAIHGITRHL